MVIAATDTIAINEEELHEEFVRSSGPGGQNVNKVATAVQLRFDVAHTSSLPEDVRSRLMTIAKNRITDEGILVIDARRYRTQQRNRRDAREKLIHLIQKAAEQPKSRRRTKPPPAVDEERLEKKRQHSTKKKLRRPVRKIEE